jgi:hypothetical protein
MANYFTLEPPEEMPPAIIQRMKDLKCPPPIMPSNVSGRVNALNDSISRQANEIEILEKLVDDLEKRYRISFSCDDKIMFDLKSGDVPKMYREGNLTNIQLKFRLWGAGNGIRGTRGVQGDQGRRGENSLPGGMGIDGYYGIRGNKK